MISLRLYERTGQTLLGLLPEPISYQLSVEFNDIGAISFDYPTNGVNANLLTELREVAVVDDSSTELTNARFVITNINRDRVSADGFISVTGRSVLSRLDTALAYPDGGIGSGSLTRYFDTKTAGFILRTLIDAAQTRGALTGLTCGFTTTADSNSVTWADTVTQEYPARNTILSVLRSLQDYGIVEVQTNGTQIKAAVSDGLGVDRTTGLNPVVLRYGLNMTEAPEQRSADRVATVALIEGDGGLIVERTNATGVSTYGRIETSFTAAGTDDTGTAQALGDTYLGNLATTARQLTVGLTFDANTPRPLKDFTVGDYVYTATAAGLERVRVRQLTVSMSGGILTASATLGDRIFENEIRTSRKLSAISSGSVALGNGTLLSPELTAVTDDMPPSAPTGLTGTSVSYLDGNVTRSRVNLTWTPPTTNEDGTFLNDLRQYEVEFRKLTTDPWEFGGAFTSASATVSNLLKNTQYRFRVTAVDAANNRSARSTVFVITTPNYLEIPSTPSTPTVTSRLGTLTVTWDGLSNTGAPMPIDFDYMAVHVGTTAGFTPGPANYKDRLNGRGVVVLADLTYSQTYFVKLVAYNTSGVNSAVSSSASASVTPLVNTDLIGQVISSANFLNGSVDTAALASGAVSAAKIVDGAISGNKIAADAITAEKIAAGAIGADEIAAGAIVAGKIAANAVTAAKIDALAVEAGKIAANAITADKIEAGAVTAAKIEATAIDGKTITGATVRTSSGSSRVEMTASGLFVYNAGTAVVSLNANGTASFTGAVTATSGTFTGTINASGGYIGSAANGWNFNSGGFMQNSGATTILYPSGNTYALITDRAISADNGYQARLGCVWDVGGSTTSNSYWKSNARIIPGTNNTHSLGASSLLWSVVFAATGTINTSDLRAKTDIAPSVLGLDFIKALNPVSYKFKVGGNEVDKETGEVTPVPGARTHFGLIAQEVKATLEELAPGQDFAGWILTDKDDPDSDQGLRYDSFIAPMVKAIQELSARVEALEGE